MISNNRALGAAVLSILICGSGVSRAFAQQKGGSKDMRISATQASSTLSHQKFTQLVSSVPAQKGFQGVRPRIDGGQIRPNPVHSGPNERTRPKNEIAKKSPLAAWTKSSIKRRSHPIHGYVASSPIQNGHSSIPAGTRFAEFLRDELLLKLQETLIYNINQLEQIQPKDDNQRKALDTIDDWERAQLEANQNVLEKSLARLQHTLSSPSQLKMLWALKITIAAIGREIDAIAMRPDPFDRPAGTKSK